jgi:hypothetical protein
LLYSESLILSTFGFIWVAGTGMIMKKPKPWARGPLELIRHAEEHLLGSSDFDRRMVLVSFDNAIELSIITFLNLNPIQRNGWTCERAQVSKWLHNFHSKLEFLEHYVVAHLGQEMLVGRDELVYYHTIRNELYHNGNGFTPTQEIVEEIRAASNWVFLTLFGSHPSQHYSFDSAEEREAAAQECDELSSSTQVLKAVLDMQKMLGAYLSEFGGSTNQSLTSSINSLVENYSIELPDGLLDAAQKAEIVRNSIMDGSGPVSTDIELKALSLELTKLSEKVDSTLRAFQVKIVDASIEATLSAVPPHNNRVVGHVYQALGSGKGMCIVSYIIRARQIRGLERTPFFVVASRNEELLQIKERFKSFSVDLEGFRLVKVGNSKELKEICADPWGLIVFVSLDLLRKNALCFEGHCLLVGVDMQNQEFDFSLSLPGATRINFGSSPMLSGARASKRFGDLLFSFNYEAAIAEGVLTPLHVFSIDNLILSETPSGLNIQDAGTAVIETIVEDVKLAGVEQYRAIVVVTTLPEGQQLLEALNRSLRPLEVSGSTSLQISIISSAVADRGRASIDAFNDRYNSSAILIINSRSLTGVDLRDVQIAYVVSPIKVVDQYKVASLLGRSKNTQGKIMDFGRNEWSFLKQGSKTMSTKTGDLGSI